MLTIVLTAAAFCPHPPALVPALATGSDAEMARLRAACADAVADMVRAADEVLVLAAGPRPRWYDSGTASLRDYGVDVPMSLGPVRPGDGADQAELPLPLAIGAWLLGPHAGRAVGLVLDAGLAGQDAAEQGARLVEGDSRVGMLVMAEVDPDRLDPAVAFLESGSTDADIPVAWRSAAAGWTSAMDGQVLYAGAPFGVGYAVGFWSSGGRD